jgi:hypothetical protein
VDGTTKSKITPPFIRCEILDTTTRRLDSPFKSCRQDERGMRSSLQGPRKAGSVRFLI